MENATQFDLNEAMSNWRQRLAASPTLGAADVDELEAHLKDSVTILGAKGLSPYEAFWVAKGRLGNEHTLLSEFEKANPEQLWLNRALWMVSGSLAVWVLVSLVSGFASLATIAICSVTKHSALLGPISLISYLAMFIAAFLLFWQAGKRTHTIAPRLGPWMQNHPISAALVVALVVACGTALLFGVNILAAKAMPVSTYGTLMQWRVGTSLLPILLWPAVLAWLLARTARKPVHR